jgi:hypothetical protein
MDASPDPNDFEGLRAAMARIYDISTKGDYIEYELDSLQDLSAYLMTTGESGPVPAAQKKIEQLKESWSAAKKKKPVLTKTLKPLRDSHGARIEGEIKTFQGEVEAHKKVFEKESVFMYETGNLAAYERMDAMHIDLVDLEKGTQRFYELAVLFDFPLPSLG